MELAGFHRNFMIVGNTLTSNNLGTFTVGGGDSFVASENTVVSNGDGMYFGASNSTVIGNNITSNRKRDWIALNIVDSYNTFAYIT